MLNHDEKNDLPETVDCPHCGRKIKTLSIVNKGFIRGRPHSAGGPYYQHKCMCCHKEFDCFFGKEIFTRKPSIKKAFIFRLSRSIRALFVRQSPHPRRLARPATESLHKESDQDASNGPEHAADRNAPLPLIFRLHPELLTAFRAMSLDPTASVSRIKKQHKTLVKSFHPDRTRHRSPGEREEATKKLIEINRAYGTIKELFM